MGLQNILFCKSCSSYAQTDKINQKYVIGKTNLPDGEYLMPKQKFVKGPEVSDSNGIYYLDQYFSGKGTGKSIEDITRSSF